MTSMLLEDASAEDLRDEEETALIEIMTCCCRQAALGQGPPGRAVKRVSLANVSSNFKGNAENQLCCV